MGICNRVLFSLQLVFYHEISYAPLHSGAITNRWKWIAHAGFKIQIMPPRIYLKFGSANHLARRDQPFGNWRDVDEAEAYIVESWGEGFMFGALLVMSVITIANMRRGVILHKLILCEVIPISR